MVNPSSENQDELVSLRKTVNKQQQDISKLTAELSLYQDIFKKFETIFPELKETLSQSHDSKSLLSKIQSLVDKQKDNIENLQDYYEEGEKQKAIKDSIKKHL